MDRCLFSFVQNSESFNLKKRTQVLTHNWTHLTTNLLKNKGFFPHLLDVTDKMAVELDPVATWQPTYNTLKWIGIMGVKPVVKEIECAVLEQDSAVFAAVELPCDAVDVLEFLDALVARVDAVWLVQETLCHVGWRIWVNHGGSSWKNDQEFFILKNVKFIFYSITYYWIKQSFYSIKYYWSKHLNKSAKPKKKCQELLFYSFTIYLSTPP